MDAVQRNSLRRPRTDMPIGQDFANMVFADQDLTEVLEKFSHTDIYPKLAAGNGQFVTLDEVQQLFAFLGADESGTVDAVKLNAVLQKAFEDYKSIIPTIHPSDFIDSRINADDFYQILLLGTEGDVKRMTRKLNGMEYETFVLRENLIRYLRKKKFQHDNFKEMPVTFALFSIVFYMVTSHLSIPTMIELNNAVSNEVTTSLIAQKFPDKLWSHIEENMYTGTPYIGHRNQILGGIRVSRVAKEGNANGPLCQYTPWNYLWDAMTRKDPEPLPACNKVTSPASWLHWPLKVDDAVLRFNTGSTPKTWCLQKGILTANCSMAVAPDSTGVKLRPNWYLSGGRTGTLQVEVATYNKLLGYYVFYRMQATVHKSGAVTVQDLVESFQDLPVWMNYREDLKNGRLHVLVVDWAYAAVFVYTVVSLLFGIFRTLRHKQFRKFLGDFWVKVEIVNVFLVFMIFLGYFHCLYLLTGLNQLKESLPVLARDTQRYSIPQWEEFIGKSMDVYEGQVHNFVDQASRIAQGYKDLRWYITVFCYCSCLRFLKVFRANAKLNVVLQTILAAGSELLHFLIVFLSLCMAFVLVAHVLFGSQINEYDSFDNSVNTIFLFLLGYLFDDVSHDMIDNGGNLAHIWNVLFMFLMLLVSLNMVLAIIFDVYADVKEQSNNEPSLLEQISSFWKKGKKKSDETRKKPTSGQPKHENTSNFTNIASDGSDNPSREEYAQSSPKVKGAKTHMYELLQSVESELQHSAHVVLEEAEHAMNEIAEAILEDDILDALEFCNTHPEDLVTPDSLVAAMGYKSNQKSKVEEVIVQAAENSEFESQIEEVGLSSKFRLMHRIDHNVRELYHGDAHSRVSMKQGENHETDLLRGKFLSSACHLASTVQMLEQECVLLNGSQASLSPSRSPSPEMGKKGGAKAETEKQNMADETGRIDRSGSFRIVENGVLGTDSHGSEQADLPFEDHKVVIVDAAGYDFINGNLAWAGGVSKAVYSTLRNKLTAVGCGKWIQQAYEHGPGTGGLPKPSWPEGYRGHPDEIEELLKELQARKVDWAYECTQPIYATVIHAIGPNFRIKKFKSIYKDNEAKNDLRAVYKNIVKAYSGFLDKRHDAHEWKLYVPVMSGGIFSGPFEPDQMAKWGAELLFEAWSEIVSSGIEMHIEFCLYDSQEAVASFQKGRANEQFLTGFDQSESWHSEFLNRGQEKSTAAALQRAELLIQPQELKGESATHEAKSPEAPQEEVKTDAASLEMQCMEDQEDHSKDELV